MKPADVPPAFLDALVDTLLPGAGTLPSATAAGVGLRSDALPSDEAIASIIRQAGGADRFVAAAALERAEILGQVERQRPAAFRALLMAVLQDYCESAAVSAALGWRGDAPQPKGHAIAPTDAETWRRLDAVRKRGPIWRRTEAT